MADDFSADGGSAATGAAALTADVTATAGSLGSGSAALGAGAAATGRGQSTGRGTLAAGLGPHGATSSGPGRATLAAGLGAGGGSGIGGRALLEPLLAGPRVVWGVEGTGAGGLLLTTLGVDLPEEPERRVELATESRTVEWGDD